MNFTGTKVKQFDLKSIKIAQVSFSCTFPHPVHIEWIGSNFVQPLSKLALVALQFCPYYVSHRQGLDILVYPVRPSVRPTVRHKLCPIL